MKVAADTIPNVNVFVYMDSDAVVTTNHSLVNQIFRHYFTSHLVSPLFRLVYSHLCSQSLSGNLLTNLWRLTRTISGGLANPFLHLDSHIVSTLVSYYGLTLPKQWIS